MAKKTVKYTKKGTDKLPNDKPVVYKIQTASGATNYVGIAKRGRAQERIQEHLAADIIPGSTVQIEQVSTIDKARQKEKNIISQTKPKYNIQANESTKPIIHSKQRADTTIRGEEIKSKETSVKRIGPYEIFNLSIERAKNLHKIHKAANDNGSLKTEELQDAYRASIVLSISALDAFIRIFIIEKIRDLIGKTDEKLPGSLTDKIKIFIKPEYLIEAARKNDLSDRVEKRFQADFDNKSFQGTKNINENMQLIGFKDIFKDISTRANINERTLKDKLDKYTLRRHMIVHKGDYDLAKVPPQEIRISKKEANECKNLVVEIAKHIHALEKNK